MPSSPINQRSIGLDTSTGEGNPLASASLALSTALHTEHESLLRTGAISLHTPYQPPNIIEFNQAGEMRAGALVPPPLSEYQEHGSDTMLPDPGLHYGSLDPLLFRHVECGDVTHETLSDNSARLDREPEGINHDVDEKQTVASIPRSPATFGQNELLSMDDARFEDQVDDDGSQNEDVRTNPSDCDPPDPPGINDRKEMLQGLYDQIRAESSPLNQPGPSPSAHCFAPYSFASGSRLPGINYLPMIALANASESAPFHGVHNEGYPSRSRRTSQCSKPSHNARTSMDETLSSSSIGEVTRMLHSTNSPAASMLPESRPQSGRLSWPSLSDVSQQTQFWRHDRSFQPQPQETGYISNPSDEEEPEDPYGEGDAFDSNQPVPFRVPLAPIRANSQTSWEARPRHQAHSSRDSGWLSGHSGRRESHHNMSWSTASFRTQNPPASLDERSEWKGSRSHSQADSTILPEPFARSAPYAMVIQSPSSKQVKLNASAPAFQPGTAKPFTFRSFVPYPEPVEPSGGQMESPQAAHAESHNLPPNFVKPPEAKPIIIRRPGGIEHHQKHASADQCGPVASGQYDQTSSGCASPKDWDRSASGSSPENGNGGGSDVPRLVLHLQEMTRNPGPESHNGSEISYDEQVHGSDSLSQIEFNKSTDAFLPQGLGKVTMLSVRDQTISLSSDTPAAGLSPAAGSSSEIIEEEGLRVDKVGTSPWCIPQQGVPDDVSLRGSGVAKQGRAKEQHEHVLSAARTGSSMSSTSGSGLEEDVVEELMRCLEERIDMWVDRLVHEIHNALPSSGSASSPLPASSSSYDRSKHYQNDSIDTKKLAKVVFEPTKKEPVLARGEMEGGCHFDWVSSILDKHLGDLKESLSQAILDLARQHPQDTVSTNVERTRTPRAQLFQETLGLLTDSIVSRLRCGLENVFTTEPYWPTGMPLSTQAPLLMSLNRVQHATGKLTALSHTQSSVDDVAQYVSGRIDQINREVRTGRELLHNDIDMAVIDLTWRKMDRLDVDVMDPELVVSRLVDNVVQGMEEHGMDAERIAEQTSEFLSGMVSPLVSSLVQGFLLDVREHTESFFDDFVTQINQHIENVPAKSLSGQQKLAPDMFPAASALPHQRAAAPNSSSVADSKSDNASAAIRGAPIESVLEVVNKTLKEYKVDSDQIADLIKPVPGRQQEINAALYRLVLMQQDALSAVAKMPAMARSMSERLLSFIHRTDNGHRQILEQIDGMKAMDEKMIRSRMNSEEKVLGLTAQVEDLTRKLHSTEAEHKAALAELDVHSSAQTTSTEGIKVWQDRLACAENSLSRAHDDANEQRGWMMRAIQEEKDLRRQLEQIHQVRAKYEAQLNKASSRISQVEERAERCQAELEAARSSFKLERENHAAQMRAQRQHCKRADLAASAAHKEVGLLADRLLEKETVANERAAAQSRLVLHVSGERDELRQRVSEQEEEITHLLQEKAKNKVLLAEAETRCARAGERAIEMNRLSRRLQETEATVFDLRSRGQEAVASHHAQMTAKDAEIVRIAVVVPLPSIDLYTD